MPLLSAPAAELMREMDAAGFEARVALQRKADEEQLTILHFKRRQTQQEVQLEEQQQEAEHTPAQRSGSGVSAGSAAAEEGGGSAAGSGLR
jgi:hypothetical protein